MAKKKKKHPVLPWLIAGVTIGGLALAHPSDKATAAAQTQKTQPPSTSPAILSAQAAKKAGWTGINLVDAVAVAGAESQWNPDATHVNTNGTTDYGEWEDNSANGRISNWRDIDANAKKAHEIWEQQGWHAWSTVNNGAYLKYMAQAEAAVKATGGNA